MWESSNETCWKEKLPLHTEYLDIKYVGFSSNASQFSDTSWVSYN